MVALINPSKALNTYRKSDAVFIVCQNNSRKIVEIAALNDEAMRVTGYTNEELVGQPLSIILPERIASIINEFVEFQEDEKDLFAVLSKIREFAIKTSDSREVEFKLRIIPGEAIDKNPWFHLVLVDEEKLRKESIFRDMLKENFKGHEVINETTGLPNRLSLIKDVELIIYYVQNKNISASFAVLDINHYEGLKAEYGEKVCTEIHKHISTICKQKLRSEDTIGTLSERSIGIILVDASQEAARMVLNRLRWAISITALKVKSEELLTQVNVCFTEIDGKISNTELIEKCEGYMAGQRAKINNSIQLVVTHERRAEPADRRKVSIPVEKERRRMGDRRGKRKK